jgi:hypothetical protein
MLKNNLFYIKSFTILLSCFLILNNFKTINLLQMIFFKLYFLTILSFFILIIILILFYFYPYIYWFENKAGYNIIILLSILSAYILFYFSSKYHLFYSLNETYLLNSYKQNVQNIFEYFFFIINFFINVIKFNYLFLPFALVFIYNLIFLIKILNIIYIKYFLLGKNWWLFNIFYFSKNI